MNVAAGTMEQIYERAEVTKEIGTDHHVGLPDRRLVGAPHTLALAPQERDAAAGPPRDARGDGPLASGEFADEDLASFDGTIKLIPTAAAAISPSPV